MPLTLRPNADSPLAQRQTDHNVMSGELQVGRIYKRESATKPELQWLWAINGVHAAPDVMRVAGMRATFEEARADLSENWETWLAWAKLQELGGSSPRPSPASQPESPGSST
jgi:hypothetical protein